MFTTLDNNKKADLARLCGVNTSDSPKKVTVVYFKCSTYMFCSALFSFYLASIQPF